MKLNIYDLEDYQDLPVKQKIKKKKKKEDNIYSNKDTKNEKEE